MTIRSYIYTHYPRQYGMYLELKSQLALPIKLLLSRLNFKIYLGDKQQDKWIIEEVFKHKKNGYFVDLASTDGIFGNNTYILEKKYNWNGICIEPNEKFFKKLKKNRNCNCFDHCIGEWEKEIDFIFSGSTGGIIGNEYDNCVEKRAKRIRKAKKENKIKKIKTKTLEAVLESAKSPKIIDYLNLDIEGAEYDALKNFPFDKYTFLAITIERPTKELNNLLFRNNYIFIKNYKADSFYVHKKLYEKINIKCEEFYQLPGKSW